MIPRQRDLLRYGLFAFLLAILAVFLIYPILLSVVGGFLSPVDHTFTTRYFLAIFQDPLLVAGMENSLLLGLFTTLACIAVGTPLAVLATRYSFPGKSLLTSLMLIPLILPPFVGAIGIRAIFGRFGALNQILMNLHLLDANHPGIDFLGGAAGGRFAGVVFMNALHLYPILYLNVAAALANIDPALDEAAIGLGAGRARRFFKITLPLISPGLFAGGTIVFISAFTELGTPLMFDYYTVTPVQIFWGLQDLATNPRPFALVVLMLLVAGGLYAGSKFFFAGRSYAMQSKAATVSGTTPLSGIAAILAPLAFGLIIGVAVLPHIGVVLSSFTQDGAWYRSVLPTRWTISHYATALSHPLAMGSIQNSLTYASVAMVVCVAMGLSIAYLVTRVKIPGAAVLDSLAMLPLAVPGLVMAFGYVAMSVTFPFSTWSKYLATQGFPGLGSLLQITGDSPNPTLFLVIAYAIRRLPYVVRAASAGLEQTSVQLEEAAANLGASGATTMRRIVIPLIAANLIAGGILAFSFAMLEVSDSLVLAQREQYFPVTRAIFEFFGRLGDGPYIASAMGVWAMALLTVTLVGASLIMGKRMGAVFKA